MILWLMPSLPATVQAADGDSVVINAMDYGADPTGAVDSTEAIGAALEAAKESEAAGKAVTLRFPRGEYHIYKDKAQTREYHTSNTNSIENPIKTIGLLIEEHKNLTIDGEGSLFMMHGNRMALAVVRSENITLKDFTVPTVTELTVTASGSDYTEFYITDVGNNVICVNYSWKNSTQAEHHKVGIVIALCGNAHRETAGAFTWESKNVLAEGVTVHFMHGFGWLIQMSEGGISESVEVEIEQTGYEDSEGPTNLVLDNNPSTL